MRRSNQHIPGKNNRIESLDFLRGLASFAVVIFHYTATSSIDLSNENPLRIIGSYGHSGVEIFFIISGLVIPFSMYASSYKINLIGKFLLKRTLRIEIPYLTIIILEVLMIYASSLTPWKNGVSERLDGLNILLHIGYLNEILNKPWLIPAFWTLAIEFQFYLLIAISYPLLLQSNFIIRILFITCIVALSFILPQHYLFFSHSLFFLIGIITFQVMVGVVKRKEFLAVSLGLFFLVYLQHGFISLFVSAGTMAIVLFCKCDWKWSGFLGIISYSLYLIHIPFGGRLLMLTNIYVQSEEIKSLLIIGFLACTIFIAWLFYLFVEKPSVLLSKRITY